MHTHRNIIFYLSIIFLVILGAAAVSAPLIAPYPPTTQDLAQRFKPSSTAHLLGTDNFGRDIFSRVIFGSRSALLVGIVAVSIAVTIGTIVGLTAGLSRGYIDNFLM